MTAPLLLLGARGTLGSALTRVCEWRGWPCAALQRDAVNLLDPSSIELVLRELRPAAVVNAAGFVRVDETETRVAECFSINTRAPALMASCCARAGTPFVAFSSDLVFDGRKNTPYLESDKTAPLNSYGRSKAQMESLVLRAHPGALVIRTGAFFGPWDTRTL